MHEIVSNYKQADNQLREVYLVLQMITPAKEAF